MTRNQAIAMINERLASLDDERVMAAADMISELAATGRPLRRLTDRELSLIEQSKEDFSAGRTYSIDAARAHSDKFIESLRRKYPSAP